MCLRTTHKGPGIEVRSKQVQRFPAAACSAASPVLVLPDVNVGLNLGSVLQAEGGSWEGRVGGGCQRKVLGARVRSQPRAHLEICLDQLPVVLHRLISVQDNHLAVRQARQQLHRGTADTWAHMHDTHLKVAAPPLLTCPRTSDAASGTMAGKTSPLMRQRM